MTLAKTLTILTLISVSNLFAQSDAQREGRAYADRVASLKASGLEQGENTDCNRYSSSKPSVEQVVKFNECVYSMKCTYTPRSGLVMSFNSLTNPATTYNCNSTLGDSKKYTLVIKTVRVRDGENRYRTEYLSHELNY